MTEQVKPLHMRVDDEVELKTLNESDAGELFRVVDSNRGHLKEWLPWVDANQREVDSLEFIRGSRAEFAKQTEIPLGIFYQGRIVGHLSLMKILPGHQAEIGYWLDQKSEGHGIISRSTLAVARYGFESMKLQRIEIRCRVNNTKSRRVPERLSFTLEGILRDSEFFLGKYYDLALYSLLKTDKIAKQA